MKKPKYKQDKASFEKAVIGKELILYGRTKLAREICDTYVVKYIVDDNDEYFDKPIKGTPIFTKEKLYAENPDNIVILICSSNNCIIEIINTIDNIDDFVIFSWNTICNKKLSDFSCQLFDHYNDISCVKNKLYDCMSVKVFSEIVNRRMWGATAGYGDLKVEGEQQYLFPPALYSKTDGVLLDCGGYVGDSFERFVRVLGENIKKIYSIEAFSDSVELIKKKKDDLKDIWNGELSIIPYALSNKKEKLLFYETEKKGGCFSPAFNNMTDNKDNWLETFEVEALSIDDIVPNNEKVRFIKMDIEGAEFFALQGARRTICQDKPGLAISIYHNSEDYYRIIELIADYVPEYKFSVRHHKDKHVDTVLYAWI